MDAQTAIRVAGIVDVVLLFTLFVGAPLIASGIGYAAWKGRAKNFSREMYWTAFAASGGISIFLMVYAQQMGADVRTWQYPVRSPVLN
jgi:cytochrome bd-type quinol oxidase subunit 1